MSGKRAGWCEMAAKVQHPEQSGGGGSLQAVSDLQPLAPSQRGDTSVMSVLERGSTSMEKRRPGRNPHTPHSRGTCSLSAARLWGTSPLLPHRTETAPPSQARGTALCLSAPETCLNTAPLMTFYCIWEVTIPFHQASMLSDFTFIHLYSFKDNPIKKTSQVGKPSTNVHS